MSQTALITGASKRVGRAIAERLAANGWNLIIHYYSSEKEAVELLDFLKNQYPQQSFTLIKANLAIEEEVEKIIPHATGIFDLLINNASLFDKSYIQQTDIALFNSQMNVNLKAPFILIRDFAIHCKKGHVINLVDTKITTNKSNYAAYSLSKKALWELTKMAALEYAPEIRVNAIAPGVSIPPEGKGRAYIEHLARNIPAREPVGLEPILQGVEYIIKTKYLTGQLLFADGGENLGQNK
ncbi:MAG TPA: SDR family NAD(P)-dependent oxidoreductase [Mariniphaga sp.]|nr:SDR family NAD(P)-dependent oxidoreductase [Mariniphaga sp.]